jgi:hypothetical protein
MAIFLKALGRALACRLLEMIWADGNAVVLDVFNGRSFRWPIM